MPGLTSAFEPDRIAVSVPSQPSSSPRAPRRRFSRGVRLLRHADFERVYQDGRRHFSARMTVFYLFRDAGGPRLGFTVGRALGGAVVRNRMKRRLREAARNNLAALAVPVDVVINPKRSLLAAPFPQVLDEMARAFEKISGQWPGVSGQRKRGAE